MPSFILTLTPDQPAATGTLATMIQKWNPTSTPLTNSDKGEQQFSIQLPTAEQERLTSLFSLQECLHPHAISFALEPTP